MREDNENIFRETEAAFAFAVLFLNSLILAAVIGIIWSLQLLLSAISPFGIVLSETIWR